MRTPAARKLSTVKYGVLPNSVMLASNGTGTAAAKALNSSSCATPPRKSDPPPPPHRPAPARWPPSIPSPATASVRAMTRKSGSVRPEAAACTRSTISSVLTSFLLGRCPQRFRSTWSSICMARRPRRDHLPRGLRRIVPPGIHIHQHGQRRGRANAPHILRHLIARGEAQVGQTERRIGHPGSRNVKRAETRPLGQHGGIGMDGARDLQRTLRRQCFPKLFSGCHTFTAEPLSTQSRHRA
jgi:hypothetical protein